jgi:hypothetical protein
LGAGKISLGEGKITQYTGRITLSEEKVAPGEEKIRPGEGKTCLGKEKITPGAQPTVLFVPGQVFRIPGVKTSLQKGKLFFINVFFVFAGLDSIFKLSGVNALGK